MINCCNNTDFSSLCEKFKCTCKETENGIQIDLEPKDLSKTKSFKALVKACKDFCGCC